jgi:hypothetical protein
MVRRRRRAGGGRKACIFGVDAVYSKYKVFISYSMVIYALLAVRRREARQCLY